MHPSNSSPRHHISPRGIGRGPGVGGIVKVTIVGTCTYLIFKKLFHAGQNNPPPTSQNASVLPQPPGTRYPYQ